VFQEGYGVFCQVGVWYGFKNRGSGFVMDATRWSLVVFGVGDGVEFGRALKIEVGVRDGCDAVECGSVWSA
jgi:hypothetical protein